VVIDGVSLAANYRAQFGRVIQASSYGDLIRQMRARVPGMPTAPLMTTAVEDAHPIAPMTPGPPSERERTEPPEAAVRQAPPPTARRLASLLREQEPLVSPHRWVVVEAVVAPGPALARVRVGPFPDHPEAASKLRELQARGYQPFITEERD